MTPASPAWDDGFAPHHPGATAKKIQRIARAAASYPLKEWSMCDADKALVRQSQDGDSAAFAQLIRKHQRMIHSLTYRMTGSEADAEDLAQETFINAYRQIGSYQGASKFSTWLYRIAINACISWRRKEARRAEAMHNWANDAQSQQESENSEPCGEWNGRMHEALLRLPAKQRAAIMLTLYDGLNHAEAAEVLGCSETTVSWRVFAARTKLKRWLKKAGARS